MNNLALDYVEQRQTFIHRLAIEAATQDALTRPFQSLDSAYHCAVAAYREIPTEVWQAVGADTVGIRLTFIRKFMATSRELAAVQSQQES